MNTKNCLRHKELKHLQLPSRDFWAELESIRELLQPLDEKLKMSEWEISFEACTDAVDGHYKLLEIRKIEYPAELESFMSPNNGTFAPRYQRQTKPFHVAAYYLMPENRTKCITEHFDSKLQAFSRQYTSSEAEYEARTAPTL